MVEQFEVESYAPRQCGLAAAQDDRAQQQNAFVDQAPEGLGRDPNAPTLRSRTEVSPRRRTASGSDWRSILVRAVEVSLRVVE
ncbi:MAG: hypothetical protein HGA44_01235 [Cellulomonadaceae bacterium]|nr:hypothetical protein [Cellulomonadaceae bacterium]